MSIATEITRLQNAKTAIKTAIEGKGVTVPDATLLGGMAALIESIEAGGSFPGLEGQTILTGTYTPAEDITSTVNILDARVEANTAYTVLAFPLGTYSQLYEELGKKNAFIGSVSKRHNTRNNNTAQAALHFDAYGGQNATADRGFQKGYPNSHLSVSMSSSCKIYAGKTYFWIAIKDV